MTRALQFIATIQQGRIKPPGWVAGFIRRLEGHEVGITLSQRTKKRSNKQNDFYHGPFIGAFADYLLACGHRVSEEDIHAGLRDAYAKNGFVIELPGGLLFRVPPSTARLSTSGFEEYLEEIRAHFATQFGWHLPLPNEDQFSQPTEE